MGKKDGASNKGKFYITTAIDYPNADPHIGHAYEKLCADVIARWHRLLGEEVFFLTGTDEHGLKIMRSAQKAGLTPKEFVDKQSLKFVELCRRWNISNNRFIRTTEEEHIRVAQEIFNKIYKKGDIYLGQYVGPYCTDCETFYTEKDLKNGLCPVHAKKCEIVKEESYFFKLSKYKEFILEYIDKRDDSIKPDGKKEEIKNRLKAGLEDLSVSRTSFDWGVPVPKNPKHVQYVWIDALINYISGVDYPKERFRKFWPADVHIIGKDIVWHHTVIWWSILKAAGIKLPKTVLVHGFILSEGGEKMSKSSGKVINPIELADKYNIDAVRYYLIRETPFGEDGYFSESKLIERNNTELANDVGNFANRVLALISQKSQGVIPKGELDREIVAKLNIEKIKKHFERFELHLALAEIMGFVKQCNQYINEKEPWKKSGVELNNLLYTLAECLYAIAVMLSAFMPATSDKIAKALKTEVASLKDIFSGKCLTQSKVESRCILFEKILADNKAKTF
ncbi:MAG: methionine--tRNA ligase [Candidatus Diapherotrites archaeon]|nr:methionine--tRNA ligase [Candidatus Diapherotrites archaeon]